MYTTNHLNRNHSEQAGPALHVNSYLASTTEAEGRRELAQHCVQPALLSGMRLARLVWFVPRWMVRTWQPIRPALLAGAAQLRASNNSSWLLIYYWTYTVYHHHWSHKIQAGSFLGTLDPCLSKAPTNKFTAPLPTIWFNRHRYTQGGGKHADWRVLTTIEAEHCRARVGNLSPAMGARNQVGIQLSYRPASLWSLSIQFQTRFLESLSRLIAGLKFPTQLVPTTEPAFHPLFSECWSSQLRTAQ